MTSKTTYNLYDFYKTDDDLEEGGAWCEILPGVRFKVRRLSSKAVEKVREKLLKPHQAVLRAGKDIPTDVAIDIAIKQLAYAAVVEWEGVNDAEGNTVELTKDAAYKILTDLPEVATTLITFATEGSNYQAEADEAAEKNS